WAFEDKTTGHQDIGTRRCQFCRIVRIDPTIDLDQGLGVFVDDHALELPDFLIGVFNKGLPSKTWVDTHQDHNVYILYDLFQKLYGRMWVQGHPGLHALGLDGLKGPVQ